MTIDHQLQDLILARRTTDEGALLTKTTSTSYGASSNGSMVNSRHGWTWSGNVHHHHFLPGFGSKVEAAYGVKIPPEFLYGGDCVHDDEKHQITVNLKSRDGQQKIKATFPAVGGLFELRNKAAEGSPIMQVENQYREDLPFPDSRIKTGFNFAASSYTREITARMYIDQPNAEEVIKNWLDTLERRVEYYRELETHFKYQDASGRELFGARHQSNRYVQRMTQLNKSLFGELARVLKAGEVDYEYKVH
ncbi:MAG: hypothetical protein WCV90_00280 [Candidatus Woesearchaeota archaeon]|jgi:hypothetical protein